MSETPMPDRRDLIRQKVYVGGQKLYLDVGLRPDGTVGEIWITVEKTGSELRSLIDELARVSSKLLQHGCGLEEFAQGWLGMKGSPSGTVQGDPRIKFATSLRDYIARHLLIYHCGREDLAHAPAPIEETTL